MLAELSWTDAEQTQAIDRVHRIGQDEPVTAWRIIAAQTIDAKIAELIDSKAGLAARALDGADEEVVVVGRRPARGAGGAAHRGAGGARPYGLPKVAESAQMGRRGRQVPRTDRAEAVTEVVRRRASGRLRRLGRRAAHLRRLGGFQRPICADSARGRRRGSGRSRSGARTRSGYCGVR